MKFLGVKRIFSSVLVAVLVCLSAFSTELWNGFKDTMDYDEVVARFKKLGLDEGDLYLYEDRIEVCVKNEPFAQSGSSSNICMRFFAVNRHEKLRLGLVSVIWDIPYDAVQKAAIKEHGKKYKEEKLPFPEDFFSGTILSRKIDCTHWKLDGKEIFVRETYVKEEGFFGGEMLTRYDVLSNKVAQKYDRQLQKTESQRRKDDRAKKLIF